MIRKVLLLIVLLLVNKIPANAQVGLFIRPNSSSLSSPVSGQTWLFNSTNNTMNVWNGSAFQVASAPQNNFSATRNPTSTDDNTVGYSAASLWYNTSNGNTYTCVSAATSAAIWVQTNNLGGLTIPLTQLDTSGASTGQSIIFNGTHWAPGSPNILLSQLLQSGATTGQVPVWNGSAWVPGTTSGGGAVSLSQLTQSGATTGEVPQWNGSAWQATNPASVMQMFADNEISTRLAGNPSGSWGLVTANSQTYSSDTTLQNSDPSFIYIDDSSGPVTITLPKANLVLGKVFTLIIINFTNNVTFQTDATGPDQLYLYGNPTPITSLVFTSGTTTNYPLMIISDGANQPGNWYQLTPPAP